VNAAREGRGIKRDTQTARNFTDEAASLLVSAFNELSDEERKTLPAGLRSAFERGGDAPGDGSKPYGNVTYADPGYQADKVKRYPLNTAIHVKAAWAYINKAKNAGMYSAANLAKVKAAIMAACKKFGIDTSEQNMADYANEWRFYLKSYDPTLEIRTNHLAELGCPTCESPLFCKKCAGASDSAVGDDSTSDTDDHPTDNQGNEYKSASNTKETRKLKAGTAKRVVMMHTDLKQAVNLISSADPKTLPQPVLDAAALISGAKVHAGHIMDKEGLSSVDALTGRSDATAEKRDDGCLLCPVCAHLNDPDATECIECGDPLNDGERTDENTSAEQRENQPKPDESTSAILPDEDALRFAVGESISRQIALDI
jgi:hypothetical protein